MITINDKELKLLAEYLLQRCQEMTNWTQCTSIDGCRQCNLKISRQIEF